MKRIIKITTLLIAVIGLVFCSNEAIMADSDDSNFTNLIIFVRFADEDEFIDNVYEGEAVRNIIDNSYNTAAYNVGDYFRCASDGKLRMRSVYLFDNGGSIKLSHPRGYYAEYSDENKIGYADTAERARRMYELRLEWSNAVNAAVAAGNVVTNYDGSVKYGFDELDKDGNGTIDAITIIYKNTTQSNISVGWGSPLWNYKDIADYVEINTGSRIIKSYKYFQVTHSYAGQDGNSNGYLYRDVDGKLTVSISAAIHEMGHIMGLLDLYNSSNASPVYFMSVMAKHMSPVPQFMSLKEKEALGWVDDGDVKTIVADGEYSLSALGTTKLSDAVGYKLDIPEKDKTLYLEYRNFAADGNKYDCQDKDLYKIDGNQVDKTKMKSGLVCYLVDTETKFPSNMNYSGSKWNYQVVGGEQGTKADAALAVGEDIEIYGKIKIEVTDINDNVLTFKINGDFAEHVHSGGEATCVKRAVCSECQQEYGDLNPDNHKNTVIKESKKPTCIDNGYTGDTYCADCNKKISTGNIIDKTAHQFKHVEAKAATAASEGNIEYYICQVCNRFFLDASGAEEVEKSDTVTAKLAPVITDGNNTVVDAESGKSISFRSNAALSDFIRVELDGNVLVKDKEFTVKEGSIIVTLMPEFIESLDAGKHTIGIVSSSGTASAVFSVTKNQESTGSEEPGSTQEPTSSEELGSTQEPTSSEEPGSTQEPTSTIEEPGSAGPSGSGQDVTTDSEKNSVSEDATGGNTGYLSPNTGDNLHVKAWMIISGLLAGAYMTFRFKKK